MLEHVANCLCWFVLVCRASQLRLDTAPVVFHYTNCACLVHSQSDVICLSCEVYASLAVCEVQLLV